MVKMMRWRPWPPLNSKKYEVKLKVRNLEGVGLDWAAQEGAEKANGGLAVEIRWKGLKGSLGSFRKIVKRNCTREVDLFDKFQSNGVLVEWEEEFYGVCTLSGYKDNVFHPWEISFSVLQGLNQGAKNKSSVLGSATLNLAEYASKADQVIEVKIPVTVPGENCPILCISLSLLELKGGQEQTELMPSPKIPILSPSTTTETSSSDKDEISALKAGLRKVKMIVTSRRAKKACRTEDNSDGRYSTKSEEVDAYPFDSDSLEEFEDGESDAGKEESSSSVRKSFSYGPLSYANYAGALSYSNACTNREEDWIYYSNRRKSDVGCSNVEEPVLVDSVIVTSRRSILPWKKRKLSFRSPRAKGEPLLNKNYGEEGGDDIDYDRRQLSSDESLSSRCYRTDEDSNAKGCSLSDFGDDNFAVGTWEQKEITSRDGQMKIQTEVFFASIDQRSERAAGESACTALVAVIADWFHNNPNLMPIKSQFDSLIRDGSSEWRNLCEIETYRENFPDKHFDLETVLQAKIRNLCVVPDKSFIGFFHPDDNSGGNFDFLHGAMSFDNIWEEISRSENSNGSETSVFIVSWNDHFFVLKVETDAYYIIDTLGERLHEGCSEAYILKFDRNTTIYNLPSSNNSTSEEKTPPTLESQSKSEDSREVKLSEDVKQQDSKEEIVCEGKESCKEYIKGFLASIPIRELQDDIKKGRAISTPVHHRLQIEFHFTKLKEHACETREVDGYKGS